LPSFLSIDAIAGTRHEIEGSQSFKKMFGISYKRHLSNKYRIPGNEVALSVFPEYKSSSTLIGCAHMSVRTVKLGVSPVFLNINRLRGVYGINIFGTTTDDAGNTSIVKIRLNKPFNLKCDLE